CLDALQQIAVQAFPDLHASGRDEVVRYRCVEGLGHGQLREHLLRTPSVNTAELKRTALRFITVDRMSNPSDVQQHSVMTVEQAIEPRHEDSLPKATALALVPSRGISRGRSNWTWNRRPEYNNCRGRQMECIYCRRFGRNAWRCGHNRFRNPGESFRYYLSSCHVNHTGPITLKCTVQGIVTEILLDTGASVSLIKEEFLKRLNHKAQYKRCSSALITADGEPLKVCYTTVLDLKIEKYSGSHEFLVCPTLTWNIILGVDFMLKHQVSIHVDRAEAKISEATVHLHQCKGATKPVTHVGISELVRQVQSNHMIKENDRRATIAVLQQF
ncbi:Gag-Pol polyprotein, partial [Schistosoma japonicum]